MALRYFEWVIHIHLRNVKVTRLRFKTIFSWKSYSSLMFFFLAQLLSNLVIIFNPHKTAKSRIYVLRAYPKSGCLLQFLHMQYCGITKEKNARGYVDAAAWEEVKKKGDKAVKGWIDSQLKGTSVTVVLIGKETCERKYVQYEIKQSYKKRNDIIGIYPTFRSKISGFYIF